MTNRWNPALRGLIGLLAGLYPDKGKAQLAVMGAGLDPNEIEWEGVPRVVWMKIVEEANKRDLVPELIRVAKEEFLNKRQALEVMEEQLRQPPAAQAPRDVPKMDEGQWKAPAAAVSGLERVIGDQPTFLPISFLLVGLDRSRSVVRVNSPLGVGTGFLIAGNLLITNNHVISSKANASSTTLWFNYQQTPGGADAPIAEFGLDPDSAFATSPVEGGDDWTAVRVRDNAQGDANSQWGRLELSDVRIGARDYVNIIQHPGGLPKQIALYHNVVAWASDERVQYLTDTLPGSSGSPVFDSRWRVVALHHAGGNLMEPGSGRLFFRNEGIHGKALIRGLTAAHLIGR
jgi:hypothetical protein